LDRHAPPQGIINMAQRLKARRRTPEVKPTAPEEESQQTAVPINIKELGLGMLVLHPHGPQPVEQRALAAPGGSKTQEMPKIAEMVHDPEERVLLGLHITPRAAS